MISLPCPFHASHDVLVMSLPFLSTPPSCPCHFLGMSASFSMHVPFFRCESVPCISRRADWLPCPLFPFHSPCTPLVFISVPIMSLSVPPLFPFHFPLLSCHVDSLFLPSFPCTSLHFPCGPQQQRGRPKHRVFKIFGKRRKSRQGDLSLGPLFGDTGSPKTTFSGTSSNYRAARGGPPPPPVPYISDVGRGWSWEGGYPLSSLRCPTRRAMLADFNWDCVKGIPASFFA